jgi:hypothetical protein
MTPEPMHFSEVLKSTKSDYKKSVSDPIYSKPPISPDFKPKPTV